MTSQPKFTSPLASVPKPGTAPSSKLSFIEDHEIEEARELVAQEFINTSGGKPLKFRVAGPKILVKIHIRPEELATITNDKGEAVTLWRPPVATAEDKFNSCSGLVLDIGDQAYQGVTRDGAPRFPNGPYCRVGDWIVFDRYGVKRVTICGVACAILYDDQVDGVIDEPSDIEAGHAAYHG